MNHAIAIWRDIFAWLATSFVSILESFGGWPLYVLSAFAFAAFGALVVPAFSHGLRLDRSDHRPSGSTKGK